MKSRIMKSPSQTSTRTWKTMKTSQMKSKDLMAMRLRTKTRSQKLKTSHRSQTIEVKSYSKRTSLRTTDNDKPQEYLYDSYDLKEIEVNCKDKASTLKKRTSLFPRISSGAPLKRSECALARSLPSTILRT